MTRHYNTGNLIKIMFIIHCKRRICSKILNVMYVDINISVQEINTFRGMLGTLFSYDMISIPLVYTQVRSGLSRI